MNIGIAQNEPQTSKKKKHILLTAHCLLCLRDVLHPRPVMRARLVRTIGKVPCKAFRVQQQCSKSGQYLVTPKRFLLKDVRGCVAIQRTSSRILKMEENDTTSLSAGCFLLRSKKRE
jgi:hypothetical protein